MAFIKPTSESNGLFDAVRNIQLLVRENRKGFRKTLIQVRKKYTKMASIRSLRN